MSACERDDGCLEPTRPFDLTKDGTCFWLAADAGRADGDRRRPRGRVVLVHTRPFGDARSGWWGLFADHLDGEGDSSTTFVS
jgi:hypothetical protein